MRKQINRLIAWLAVLALMVGLLPAAAFAAGEATEITSLDAITDLSGSYLLTQDTTVTAPLSGTFTGTFDGGGHTVTVNITTAEANCGMFSAIGSGATVTNFSVENSTLEYTGSSTSNLCGLIAGQNSGTVSNVVVRESTVTGYAVTGGLVGKNSGTVTKCAFESGTVFKKSYSSDKGVGGIVGQNEGVISFCSNGATVDHTNASRYTDLVGGIAGQIEGSGTVSNCYNTGLLKDTSSTYAWYIAGIVGRNRAASTAVSNCHNYGVFDSSASNKNGISNSCDTSTCYYLSGCGATSGGTAKTAEEFLTLAATLGETNWVDGSDGYPVLEWQTWKYSNTAIKYSVEYYTEELDGTYALAQTAEVKSEPDLEVTAEPIVIDGFTFDADNTENVLTGTASEELVLKLYYTRNSYTLTWDAGEGTIISADDAYTHGTVKYGAPVTYPEAELSGYTAVWSATLTTMPAADTTVTATWKVAVYPVTWNANGGTFETDDGWGNITVSQTKAWSSANGSSCGAIYGQTFGKYRYNENSTSYSNRDLPEPLHESKVFGGWYTMAEGGEEITKDTLVTVPEDGSFTFYAHWDDAYTVTFDPNGGSVSPSSVLVGQGNAYGSDADIPTPTRTGHTFAGWYDAEGNRLTADTVISADTTFTANWTPNTYTVTFYSNGGTGSMPSQSFTYGVAQKISKNLFTYEGYRFVGWATWSSATSASYTDEQEYTIGSSNQSFYAIWEEVRHNLTLTVTPDDATVVVKNSSGMEQSATDGVYDLREGTYTYSVSKYGYETVEETITLTQDETLTIDLVKLPSNTVSFEITKPEDTGDVVITVTAKDGTVITAAEDGTYDLIAGDYSYLVTANGCNKVTADFTVTDSDLNFTIPLTIRTAWDGQTLTEPHIITAEEAVEDYAGMEGWYLITNGDELAWFANKVNTTSGGCTDSVVLAKDIDLGNEKWSPMGNSYSYYFAGTFDGMGHAIRGLYCDGTDYQALFGYSKGAIRNLTVYGEVKGKSTYTGGIAAYQNGGSFANCGSYVSVSSNYNGGEVGGIAGYAFGTSFTACFNAGTLTGSKQQGGIAGVAYGTSSFTDCYNVGTMVKGENVTESSSSYAYSAGILGYTNDYATVTLENCYNAGNVDSGYTRIGALVGQAGTSTKILNSYYLDNVTKSYAYGTPSEVVATSCTAEELKAAEMLDSLGAAYKADGLLDCSINDGYPVLTWQVLPAHTHTLTETPAKAATCTTEGNISYWICSVCEKIFSDAEGTNEINIAETVVPATDHSYTYSDNGDGTHTATCSDCGNTITEAHTFVDGTCVCGAVEVTEP
ncbi:MAG: InlB B-repeat-containing protein, partial [Faecousia sp.]